MTPNTTRSKPRAAALLSALALSLAISPALLTARQQGSQIQTPQVQTTSAPPQTPTPTPPAPSPTLQPTVKLSLIVTDESGRAIDDVRREDVSVTEDGVPQTIIYFGRETLPVSYIVAIDNSRSMESLVITLARTGGSLIAANKSADEAAIMRFVDSDNVKLLQDFTDSQVDLVKALNDLHTEGGATALLDAVYLAVEKAADWREGDTTRRRAVVLVTDGDERSSYYKLSQLEKLLRETGVPVFIIGFTKIVDREGGFQSGKAREKATQLLDLISRETGGRVFYPEEMRDLVDAVNQIARDMRTQYVVGYAPTNAASDGTFRKVEVTVASAPGQPKRIAFTRSGYVGPGGSPKGEEGDKKKKKKGEEKR